VDTLEFFDAVLPKQGLRCLGTLVDGKFTHYYGGSNEWAAEGVDRLLRSKQNIYFGCSSFATNKSRTQDNVAFVRSFWLDIDTQEGKPKEKYANRKVAVTELTNFCAELGLPRPMLVSSGYGIHAYWPCHEDMTREEWKATATLLKQATKTWGLAADPSRTSDEASVLRPVGSLNIKNGVHKDVRYLSGKVEIDRAQFHARLHVYLKNNGALPSAPAPVENINSDLMVQREYKPSSAHRIAKHCAVINEMKEKRGNIDQPTWYGSIGVLAFTEEGEDICQEWSDGHPDYSPRETSFKVSQALRYAPTTCEKLKETRCELCEGCPHFGKIKSPITLGIKESEPQYIPDQTDTDEVPDLPYKNLHEMPEGFGWGVIEGDKEKSLWQEVWKKVDEVDAEGGKKSSWVMEQVKFSDILFYPTTRIVERSSKTDWGYKMSISITDKKGAQREFILDNKLVASGGTELVAELGRREIVSDKNAMVHAYLREWSKKLRDNYAETLQITKLGWNEKSFALGTRMLTPEGERTALLGRGALKVSKNIHVQGSLELWKYAMDKLYNVKNFGAQQFCVLATFAAPLYRMRAEKGGITVFISSADSSYGKTTACRAGLTAWGNGMNSMVINKFTGNALYEYMGAMSNLPVVADELTSMENSAASALVFDVSNGEGKLRLESSSEMRDSAEWSTILIGTGNTLLSEKIAAYRANSDGEQMRLWEFTPRTRSDMPLHEFNKLADMLKENYGHAGPIYMTHIVENYDLIRQRLTHKYDEITMAFNMVSKERNWANLFATVLLARDILEELDLLTIDRVEITDWIKEELERARNNAEQTTADPAEQFARMLADLQGGILVTSGRGNLSKGESARIIGDIRGNSSLVGRYIYPLAGDSANTKEVLILSVAAARDWATKRGVMLREIESALTAGGVITRKPSRMKLGQGVAKYAGTSASILCWELDAIRMNELLGDEPLAAKLKVVDARPQPAIINETAFDNVLSGDDSNEIDDLIST